MHIAQVNYVYDPLIDDADALLDRYTTLTGWSEALLTAGASAATVVQRFSRDARIERNGVRYLFVGDTEGHAARRRSDAPRVHATLDAVDADVVHVNGLSAWPYLRSLRHAVPRPALVVHDHASGDPVAGRSARWLRSPRLAVRRAMWRRGLREADAFFFTAREQAEPWRGARFISPAQPIYEVLESSTSLALPTCAATADVRSSAGGSPAVLWVGRLNGNKDPLTVLGGFEQLTRACPRAQLTMVYGSDDLLDEVRRRIHGSPALRNRVQLRGRIDRDALPGLYAAADVFVLGSHHEGSGYALIEACAFGALPVVTAIASFRAITGGAIGELWRPGDADGCGRALVTAARRAGEASRSRVLARFADALSWPAVGRAALGAYRDVVARGRMRERA